VKPTTILVVAIVVAAMFVMSATADPNEKNLDTSLDPYTPGDLKNPLGADLHELSPNYCNDYNLSSWYDNNKDSALSPGDVIDITHNDTGVKTYWHVDTVTVTIIATDKGDKRADVPKRYFDYVGEAPTKISIEAVLKDPIGLWREIYPGSENYSLTKWTESVTDKAEELTAGDIITLENVSTKSSKELDVLEVKIDIDVRKMCLGECYTEAGCEGDMLGVMPCWQCLGKGPDSADPQGKSWTSIYCTDFCPCPCDESLCWNTTCPDCCDGIDNDKDGRYDSDGGPYGWDFQDHQCECCLDFNESVVDQCGQGGAWPCIPEAATIALVGVGILGIFGIGLRRRE